MANPVSDRVQRVSGVDSMRRGSREIARGLTPAPAGTDMLTELQKIRALLERQMKPFTVQCVLDPVKRFATFSDLPGIPTAVGTMLLDHDEDRVDIIVMNRGTALAYLKPDDGNITNVNSFPIPAQVSATVPSIVYLTRQYGISNRIFGAQDAGGGADLLFWIARIDRFPIGTR